MFPTSSLSPPAATQRLVPIRIATRIPMIIAIAYARIGSGPKLHTPFSGDGIEATKKLVNYLPTASRIHFSNALIDLRASVGISTPFSAMYGVPGI